MRGREMSFGYRMHARPAFPARPVTADLASSDINRCEV
jgi:hypothetical protein